MREWIAANGLVQAEVEDVNEDQHINESAKQDHERRVGAVADADDREDSQRARGDEDGDDSLTECLGLRELWVGNWGRKHGLSLD